MGNKHLLGGILLLPLSAVIASEAELNERIEVLEEQINAMAEMVESVSKNSGSSNTFVGGYGELHYNKNKGKDDQIDFHRFVLFLGHEFSDAISFNSELEVEHSIAGAGKAGEVEVEQAYIDVKINANLLVRSGLFLMPVGIINETHEPNTFYGVERNPVEKNIVPATWWEAGTGVAGTIMQGVSYDLYVHSGLNTKASKNYKPRDGRQKVSNATANNLAYTGRIKYTGIPGLEVASTLQYQSDITQGVDSTAGSATLMEAHVVYNKSGFGLRALYATWSLSGDGVKAIDADKQMGWYVEPSYKFMTHYGIFTRYSSYNNKASGDGEDTTQTNVGVNYWPHPSVVFKADYMAQGGAGSDKALNLGLGYEF